MTRDCIYHLWTISRCNVYSELHLGPIMTIMITHNITTSENHCFGRKNVLNLDLSCFCCCCLYLISAKHIDCMNSYQFSTADRKRRQKIVRLRQSVDRVRGEDHVHTECWSDIFTYQGMPPIARKPPTARREQRMIPSSFQREYGSANTVISDFYLLDLWDNTFRLWGTLLQQPWEMNAVENYKWTSSIQLPGTLPFDFGYLGTVFNNIP